MPIIIERKMPIISETRMSDSWSATDRQTDRQTDSAATVRP